jgi:peptidoglycan/LPS O-acetylase OafA/YrhL
MTGLSISLFDYHFVDTPQSVTLANGSLSKMAGLGNTHLSPDIELLFYMFLVFLVICYPLVKSHKPFVVLLVFTLLCAFSESQDEGDDWYGA